MLPRWRQCEDVTAHVTVPTSLCTLPRRRYCGRYWERYRGCYCERYRGHYRGRYHRSMPGGWGNIFDEWKAHDAKSPVMLLLIVYIFLYEYRLYIYRLLRVWRWLRWCNRMSWKRMCFYQFGTRWGNVMSRWILINKTNMWWLDMWL